MNEDIDIKLKCQMDDAGQNILDFALAESKLIDFENFPAMAVKLLSNCRMSVLSYFTEEDALKILKDLRQVENIFLKKVCENYSDHEEIK